jgi:hypothetical protein
MRVKPHLASFQPGVEDFLLFKFPLLLFDCRLEDFGIDTNLTCGFDQVLMTDRIRLLEFQRPPNDSANFFITILSRCVFVHNVKPQLFKVIA